ncbi:MAG TPA: chromosomal replication initiator protein DnaA [Candidatus Binatia bacterium]|jgi:chromosomal replication initiator protein
MEADWLEALPRMRQLVGDRNFATWIEPICCSKDETGFLLEVGSRFFQEWVTRHFLPTIRQTLTKADGKAPAVRVGVAAQRAESRPRPSEVPAKTLRASAPRMPKIGRLVPDYTFENFVVGQANEVAYQAARSVAEMPGRRFNPLFLCGGVGLGKTHLVNALAHDLLTGRSRRRIACLAAEAFMNNLITSLRHDQMASFRDSFREVEVLILDDVQFLAGKERTQEEFFHTFNALQAAGHQVVLTCDKPPHAIAGLEQRLRSRFEGGLIADVHPPTCEMRVAIVTKKAALHGTDLPPGVALLVAQRSGPSVRELEGALTRVMATTALRGVPLTTSLVESLLAPITRPLCLLSVEAIQEKVSQHFRVSVNDLKSHRRDRPVTFARQIAMYLSRTLAEVSFPSIAEKFGGRDHSTVMHAVRAVEDKRKQDPHTGNLLMTLEHELRSRQSA